MSDRCYKCGSRFSSEHDRWHEGMQYCETHWAALVGPAGVAQATHEATLAEVDALTERLDAAEKERDKFKKIAADCQRAEFAMGEEVKALTRRISEVEGERDVVRARAYHVYNKLNTARQLLDAERAVHAETRRVLEEVEHGVTNLQKNYDALVAVIRRDDRLGSETCCDEAPWLDNRLGELEAVEEGFNAMEDRAESAEAVLAEIESLDAACTNGPAGDWNVDALVEEWAHSDDAEPVDFGVWLIAEARRRIAAREKVGG